MNCSDAGIYTLVGALLGMLVSFMGYKIVVKPLLRKPIEPHECDLPQHPQYRTDPQEWICPQCGKKFEFGDGMWSAD